VFSAALRRARQLLGDQRDIANPDEDPYRGLFCFVFASRVLQRYSFISLTDFFVARKIVNIQRVKEHASLSGSSYSTSGFLSFFCPDRCLVREAAADLAAEASPGKFLTSVMHNSIVWSRSLSCFIYVQARGIGRSGGSIPTLRGFRARSDLIHVFHSILWVLGEATFGLWGHDYFVLVHTLGFWGINV